MRVRFALTGYLPEIFGGAEVYTHRLAAALQRKGHDVGVVCLDFKHRRGIATDAEFEGISVHRLGFNFAHRSAPLHLLQFFPEIYDEATQWLDAEKPDVVHITNAWYMPAFAMAALHRNIPVVATHVDFVWACRESHFLLPDKSLCVGPPDVDCAGCFPELTAEQWSSFREMRTLMHRLLAEAYVFHHCPCPLMARHVAALGASEDKIGVWPYGVLEGERLQRSGSDIRLAFIGRWNRIKGIDVLLTAMEKVGPSVVLQLFGEQESWNNDSFAEEQGKKAKRLGNVEVMGRFDPAQLPDVLREIDALVLPSIWPENSPVSILEALALGVPVICADGEGMTNIVQHEINGLVFRSRDADDLAVQITRFANDASLRNRLRQGASCVRTIDRDAEDFAQIYQNAAPPTDRQWLDESRKFVQKVREAHNRGDFERGSE